MTSKFATKFAARKTTTTAAKAKVITPTTKVEMPEPAAPAVEDEVHTAWQQVEDAVRGLASKIKRPSWVRELVNVTIGLVSYCAAIYGLMQLIDIVVMAAIAYTGVGFISFLVTFLSMFAAFMAAFSVGKFAYEVASKFDFNNVKSRVVNAFTFRKPIVAA